MENLITNKFNINQSVFVIFNNKIIESTIKTINFDSMENKIQYAVRFNDGGSENYIENEIFETKKLLIDSL